jgi:hypothetical protein
MDIQIQKNEKKETKLRKIKQEELQGKGSGKKQIKKQSSCKNVW